MKKTFFYTIVVFAITFLGLQSCKKYDNIKSEPNTTTAFSLKDANNQTLQYLDTGLLQKIHKDLLANGRTSDAAQLFSEYDTQTGYLKSLGKQPSIQSAFINVPIDSSKIKKVTDTSMTSAVKAALWHPYGELGYAWVQSHGWVNTYYPCTGGGSGYQAQNFVSIGSGVNTGNGFQYVGTTGQSLRLEGFYLTIDTTQFYLIYGIQTYPGQWFWNNSGQGPVFGPGGYVGTQGQSMATCYLSMYFTGSTANHFHIYYVTHHAVYGWQTWCGNGEVAGMTNIQIQAFAYQIVKY